jgi:hypothetical protein
MFRKVSIRMSARESSNDGQNARNPLSTNERSADLSLRRRKKSDALKEVWVKNSGWSNMNGFLVGTLS